MCELDCEESWTPKNWCFWTVVLEKTLESPLDCKEIQPVHPKGDQSWCSLDGLMLRLKLQYFGHLMQRVDSLEKTLMLEEIEGRRRRGWQRMRWLDGHESEWIPGVGDGQGGLACCSPWGCKESDTTEQLNWTKLNVYHHINMCNSLQYSCLGNFMDRRVWWATVHVIAKSWTWLNTHTHKACFNARNR